MPEQRLDVSDVNTILIQMTCKAVTAAMTGYVSGNAGSGGAFLEILTDAALIKIRSRPGAWKENASGPAALVPVLSQKIKVPVRKDRIPVTSVFTLTDMDRFFGAGYIIIMKMNDF